MIHPARKYNFDELYNHLQYAVQEGVIYEHTGVDDNKDLRLYCYTEETVYSRNWSDIAIMSRGLILDIMKKQIVATPFPKFFNYGEAQSQGFTIPDLPFETFEKMDGSLIIIFFHNGRWKCATKGSLSSDQAKWAEKWLYSNIKTDNMNPLFTWLAEAIYPNNRIVVDYKEREELVLLGAYHDTAGEKSWDSFEQPNSLGWNIVPRHKYKQISELLEKAKTLTSNEEGFVLRFSDGTRIKIKGDEYCRIHRLVSNLTPLTVWKVMRGRIAPDEWLPAENLEDMRKGLPEEFWDDFDNILKLLSQKLQDISIKIESAAKPTMEMSDKEVGLKLHEFPEEVRRFIFPYRKGKLDAPLCRNSLFESFRPDRNILNGYRASSSVVRTQENE